MTKIETTYELEKINIKVSSKINEYREKYMHFSSFIENVNSKSEIILFGGTVRDIYIDKIPRDFDIVVNTTDQNLEKIINGYRNEKNRFGGYKINIDGFDIDIWNLANTWAFKNRFFKSSFRNLVKTVFFNADSIAINISNNQIYENGFIEAFNKKELKILFEQNPYPELCVLRALVFIEKYSFNLSEDLIKYIKKWVTNETDPIIKLEYVKNTHYKNSNLKDFNYKKYLNIIDIKV